QCSSIASALPGGRHLDRRPTSSWAPSPFVDNAALLSVLPTKQDVITCQLEKTLERSHGNAIQHFHEFSFRKLLLTWVPLELHESDKARTGVYESVLLRSHRKDFVKDLVIGDESWFFYVNRTLNIGFLAENYRKGARRSWTREEDVALLLV
ncbi:hypothetical protein ANCCAN_29956, partial [Ancylostoma caninum]